MVRVSRKSAPDLNAARAAVTVWREQQPQQQSTRVAVPTIYKICPASAWREAERQGAYRGSADDKRDGFIHFSTASQIPGTIAKHFAGQAGLFLIAVQSAALGDALKWEPSRGGELFPHLYGELDTGVVLEIRDLRMRSDGSHDIPELTT